MSPSSSGSTDPVRPPRFSWPVRILLFLVLFHMIFRSTGILYPWADWREEYDFKRTPRPLPSRAELAKLREEASGSNEPVYKEFKECASSLVDFWKFVPEKETREKLKSNTDWAKYTLAWTATRLEWCECILGNDQEWAMFSPNVGKRKYVTRARMLFEDGTEFTIRPRSEPEDLTFYSRWAQGKNLGVDRFASSDHGRRWDGCPGYCNYLSHRYARNSDGSSLRAIVLYEVKLAFVPPGDDPHEFLRGQMEKTRDSSCSQSLWAFYLYDPEKRTGEFFGKGHRYPWAPLPEKFQNLTD